MKFIVVTPSFNENIGGVIALHLLCHRLNEIGFDSLIYDVNRPVKDNDSIWKKIKYKFRLRKYFKKRLINGFHTNPEWKTPELYFFDDKNRSDSIVIYPEIIQDNLLRAKKFVRWFLYFQRYDFYDDGIGEGFNIFYSEHFRQGSPAINSIEKILHLDWYHPEYFKENVSSNRKGICYQIRKHDSEENVNIPKEAICIDGLSHSEIAKIFKECELFFSYDLYSFYSVYASISGCKSVVIPKKNVSEIEWRPNVEHRYGIAYGENRIEWAIATSENLLNVMRKHEQEQAKQLADFIEICKKKFLN